MAIQKRKRSGKGRAEAAKRRCAEAQSQGSSLLRLAAETRNAIYELVFTAPGDLIVHWEAVSSPSRKKPVMMVRGTTSSEPYPINTLKYVNRQLYQETAGLEVKFNRVVFEESKPNTAAEAFLEFIKQAAPAKLTWLKVVALDEKVAEKGKSIGKWIANSSSEIAQLMAFCADHPQTTVELRVPEFEIIAEKDSKCKAYKFIGDGIALSLAFRGENLVAIAPLFGMNIESTTAVYARECRKHLGKHRRTIEGLNDRATNLRFCPRQVEWDERVFRKRVLKGWIKATRAPHTLPAGGGPDVWVRYARKWMADGI